MGGKCHMGDPSQQRGLSVLWTCNTGYTENSRKVYTVIWASGHHARGVAKKPCKVGSAPLGPWAWAQSGLVQKRGKCSWSLFPLSQTLRVSTMKQDRMGGEGGRSWGQEIFRIHLELLEHDSKQKWLKWIYKKNTQIPLDGKSILMISV